MTEHLNERLTAFARAAVPTCKRRTSHDIDSLLHAVADAAAEIGSLNVRGINHWRITKRDAGAWPPEVNLIAAGLHELLHWGELQAVYASAPCFQTWLQHRAWAFEGATRHVPNFGAYRELRAIFPCPSRVRAAAFGAPAWLN